MNKPTETASFTPSELRKLRSLKDPHGIQRYLRTFGYAVTASPTFSTLIIRGITTIVRFFTVG